MHTKKTVNKLMLVAWKKKHVDLLHFIGKLPAA
jgi:hypothetical protein